MSTALYRKYRPRHFADVSGQNHIKVTLQNEVAGNRLAHAYLFCGPRGTGKTTMARLLSKAANCLDIQNNGEPCNKCQSCESINQGKALDIIEIDAASHTGVDNVRENIIQNARFTPSKSKYKVFIIDEVHMLSISAFNALLKVLEEPPKYVIFILATTEAHKLPATIISRCQRFDFKKVQFNDLLQRLKWIAAQEEVSVEENVLKVIAKQSGGCVRDAESLLEQIFSLGEKNITLEKAELILPKMDNESFYKFFEMIIKNRSGQAIDLVNGLLRQGMDLNQFIDGFLLFCRQVLIYKLNNRLEELSLEFPDDIVEKLVNLSSEISTQNVSLLIKKILRARKSFDDNFISQLPLEMVIFEMTDSGGGSEVNLENKTKREVYEQPKKEEKGSFEQKSSSEGFEKKKQEIIVEKSKNEQKKDLSKDKNRENSGKDHQDLKKINKSDNIDLDELLKRWARILEKVKLEDYGVYMSLRMGKPISCQSDKIIIGFLFELQRQRLEKVDSQNVLRQALKQTMGFDPAVETAIEPSLSISDFSNGNGSSTVKKDLNETAENVAKEFDGELM